MLFVKGFSPSQSSESVYFVSVSNGVQGENSKWSWSNVCWTVGPVLCEAARADQDTVCNIRLCDHVGLHSDRRLSMQRFTFCDLSKNHKMCKVQSGFCLTEICLTLV